MAKPDEIQATFLPAVQTITGLVVVVVLNELILAILVSPGPPGDALRGAEGRGVGGSGTSTRCYHWVPLYSHAWIA